MGQDATATPDAELPLAADGTPDEGQEPADQPEASGAPADQSTGATPDPRLAQAEYTRSQQAFSALKERLNLPRTATRDEVLAAIDELQQGSAEGDEEEYDEAPEDPRIAEALAIAFNAQIQTSRAIYGDEFVDEGLNLINMLRTSDDPHELMTNLAAFVDRAAAGAGTAAPAPEGGAPAADPNAVPAPVGVQDDDRGPSARQPISQSVARREPGTVSAVRGIFEGLGIATRTRS